MQKSTITVDTSKLARWRIAKATYELDAGGKLSWGEYLDILISNDAVSQGQVETIRGAGLLDDEVDDLTLQVAGMIGSQADLSDSAIDKIVERLAEKLKQE